MYDEIFILNYVRKVAYYYLSNKKLPEINSLEDKKGVFVTIYKNNNLRGCVGYAKPYFSLNEGLKKATVAALSKDNRFSPVNLEEYNDLEFEITILDELILLKDKLDFEIGKDGLMIEDSGLLLAQVATENNFSKIDFLEQVCVKAGFDTNAWKKYNIYKFECEIIKIPKVI